jgi:hypothetical protein
MVRADVAADDSVEAARLAARGLSRRGWTVTRLIPDLIKHYAIARYARLNEVEVDSWIWNGATPPRPIPEMADMGGKWFLGEIRAWMEECGFPVPDAHVHYPTMAEHDAIVAALGCKE